MQLNNQCYKNKFFGKKGFTLVEVLVASTLLFGLSVGFYQSLVSLQSLTRNSKLKAQAVALANEQIEIARNLPYSDVGIVNGWPVGKIPREQSIKRGNSSFVVITTIRNIDDPFDGLIGGSPNDLTPADYKLMEVVVSCPTCRALEPVILSTFIAPKNLETSSGNGALFVRVIDSNGQAVPLVSVRVQNLLATSTLIINDETNNEGILALVDLPPAPSAYRISVAKNGFTSARTYSLNDERVDDPVNQDATILAGQLTQVSLTIDPVSQLKIQAINEFCSPMGPFALNLKGARSLDNKGLVPIWNEDINVPTSGELDIANLWPDTYSLTPLNNNLVLLGSFPLQSVYVPAGASSLIKLLLGNKSPSGLLVSVRDGVSSLPLTGALVTLESGVWSQSLYTSRGFFRDDDWSSVEYETDGNLDLDSPAGEIRLKEEEGNYQTSGYLVSTILDAGTASTTFYNLNWLPWDQATSTGIDNIRFQLAVSNDPATSTWSFVGPDGSSNTYYSKANNNISSLLNNHRYLRYKVFLQTADSLVTPNLSEISLTYSSECLPYGQIFFSSLGRNTYSLEVEKDGYQTYQGVVDINKDWQLIEVILNPEI